MLLNHAPVQEVMTGGWWLLTSAPSEEPAGTPSSLVPPRILPRRPAFPLVFLLKHAQPGNKTGVVSGAFVMDTERVKCFLVGWEPVCLQEQHFDKAMKTQTDISLSMY